MAKRGKVPRCPKCVRELDQSKDQSNAMDRSKEVGLELGLWHCSNCEKDYLFPILDNDGYAQIYD